MVLNGDVFVDKVMVVLDKIIFSVKDCSYILFEMILEFGDLVLE